MSHIPLKVEVLGEQGIKRRREAGCDAVATGRYFRHRESECHLVCNSHITDPPPLGLMETAVSPSRGWETIPSQSAVILSFLKFSVESQDEVKIALYYSD